VGEPTDAAAAALAELDGPLPVAGAAERAPGVPRDRRGGGAAGTIAALVASGEPVLVACADAHRRRGHLGGRLGGFALAAWPALERDPGVLDRYAHVVALDPPAADAQAALIDERFTLVWGAAETAYALRAHEAGYDLRPVAGAVYRALRSGPLEAAVAAAPTPVAAGRALRVLTELGLVRIDGRAASLAPAARTELERSAAFRAYTTRLAEGRARLAPAARDRRVPASAAPPARAA
jgi:hypothetical protein